MKKKLIITAIIISVLAAITTAGYYLLRGTLEVTAIPTPFSVTVSGKTYQGDKTVNLDLLIGSHKVIIRKGFYNDQPLDTWIRFHQVTTETPMLTLSTDGQQVHDLSYQITNAWMKYSQDGNKQTFLTTMQPLMTTDAYASFANSLSLAGTTNGAGITTDTQTVAGPIKSISLTQTSPTSGTSKVETTKTGSDLSVSSLEIEFNKTGSQWLASNIIYNY